MSNEYDLIVIGAGPAGTPAAMAAGKFGKKVLLVDKREAPGGECLFEGCIPSKVLENAANKFAEVKNSKLFHIDMSGNEQIHWEQVIADKAEIVKKRSAAALKAIEAMPNVDFLQGEAVFTDAQTIEVAGNKFKFKKALIASGANSFIPKIGGNGLDKVWTNKEIFYNKELPSDLLFIGAGAISCELAQMFNKLGVKCTILTRSERILKHISTEAALIVQNQLIKDGVTIEFNVHLEKIDYENSSFTLYYEQDGKEVLLTAPNVLMATGRVANVENLGLDKAGVDYDRHGVIVNEYLQSSQSNIYAAGDCINAPKFAHTASYEAGVVVHNMFAPKAMEVDFSKNSWVLFSDPQIAVAGIDEQSAQKFGREIETAVYEYKSDARAQIDKRAEGYLKYIIDKKTQEIIGAEIVSEDASSLVGEASLIVANKMKAMDILKAIHPHPTLTESFGKLAQELFFKQMMQNRRG